MPKHNKLLEEAEKERKRREELGLPEEDLTPEEVRANIEAEETEEEETEESEEETEESEEEPEPDLKAQKQRILAKIEAKLDEPEEDPTIEKLKNDFISLVLCFARIPIASKIVLTMQRSQDGKNINFKAKMTDAKGANIGVDEKTGDVVTDE